MTICLRRPGRTQNGLETSKDHPKMFFCQAIVIAWFCCCLMRVCGAACWGPELSSFFFCTEVVWCKHKISQWFCWYLQTMHAPNQHDSKIVVCDILWNILINHDKPETRIEAAVSKLQAVYVVQWCGNRMQQAESNLVPLSWFWLVGPTFDFPPCILIAYI